MSAVANSERRAAERFDIPTDGQVILPSGARLSFKIVDISKTGAQLQLQQALVLPTNFVIEVNSPDGTKVKRCDCDRSWQKHTCVGVSFNSTRILNVQSTHI